MSIYGDVTMMKPKKNKKKTPWLRKKENSGLHKVEDRWKGFDFLCVQEPWCNNDMETNRTLSS